MQDLSHKAQQAIIEDFQSDPEAFARVYDFYYEMIFRYLLKRTISAEVAYDLTADTFMKAFKAFGRFKWTGVSIKSWLFRITINVLNSHRKKPKSLSLDPEADQYLEALASNTADELERLDKALHGDDDLSKLSDAIATLNPKYQNVLSLYYFSGLSQSEIAEVLDRTPSAIKSMVHRATCQLRDIMVNS